MVAFFAVLADGFAAGLVVASSAVSSDDAGNARFGETFAVVTASGDTDLRGLAGLRFGGVAPGIDAIGTSSDESEA